MALPGGLEKLARLKGVRVGAFLGGLAALTTIVTSVVSCWPESPPAVAPPAGHCQGDDDGGDAGGPLRDLPGSLQASTTQRTRDRKRRRHTPILAPQQRGELGRGKVPRHELDPAVLRGRSGTVVDFDIVVTDSLGAASFVQAELLQEDRRTLFSDILILKASRETEQVSASLWVGPTDKPSAKGVRLRLAIYDGSGARLGFRDLPL
jgi:hypothetical protein